MDLDQSILDEIAAWGRELQGFKLAHAVDALIFVQGCVDGVCLGDISIPGFVRGTDKKTSLLAVDLAWTFWLDDFFDRAAADARPRPDIKSILTAIEGGAATTPESQGFAALRRHILPRANPDRRSLHLWTETAARTVEAWRQEEMLSRREREMSYSEYLENGVHSTAVPHIMATASLLHGFDMATRLHDAVVGRLVRNLSVAARLHNDLISVEKERMEGCGANAVLLLERFMPLDASYRFVKDDLDGYERMLARDAEDLGGDDALVRFATILPAAHRAYTSSSRDRYLAR
jgi:hypothetical protein